MRPGGRRGVPRGRLWTADELAELDRILQRGRDGLGYARKREIVALAKVTGRSVSACATRLYLRRRGEVPSARRWWTADELRKVDAILDRGGARRGELRDLAAALGRSRPAVEIMMVKRRKARMAATGGATPAADGESGSGEQPNHERVYSNGS